MSSIKNVSIVGMGALGLMYGFHIASALGNDSVSYIMDESRIKKNSKAEITVNGVSFTPKLVNETEAVSADLLIVAVKYTALSSALETMKNCIDDHTIIMSVMNGISTENIIKEHFGHDKIVYTVAQGMDAQKYGNTLTYSKMGKLHIGAADGQDTAALYDVIDFFEEIKMPYLHEADIMYRMWVKFMLNVGINQVCMVFNKTYSVTDEESEANRVLIAAMREVEVIGRAEGINLTEKDLNFCLDLERTLDQNATPSMGQDRINKKPSEVELFAGTVIALADKHGILVPANRYLYKRVYEIEKEY